MKFPKLLYPSFLCLLIAGCDMIDYHPYDVHISGETDVNAHNIAQNRAELPEQDNNPVRNNG